jgi:hypothetical protein
MVHAAFAHELDKDNEQGWEFSCKYDQWQLRIKKLNIFVFLFNTTKKHHPQHHICRSSSSSIIHCFVKKKIPNSHQKVLDCGAIWIHIESLWGQSSINFPDMSNERVYTFPLRVGGFRSRNQQLTLLILLLLPLQEGHCSLSSTTLFPSLASHPCSHMPQLQFHVDQKIVV